MRTALAVFILSVLSVFGQAPPYQRQFFDTNTDPVVQVTAGSNCWVTFTTTEPAGQVRSFRVDVASGTTNIVLISTNLVFDENMLTNAGNTQGVFSVRVGDTNYFRTLIGMDGVSLIGYSNSIIITNTAVWWWTNELGQLQLPLASPEPATGSISNNFNVGIKGLLALYGTNPSVPFIEFRTASILYSNTFVGRLAGASNTTAVGNTFLGHIAGERTIDGSYNTYVGASAGEVNVSGTHNTAVGNGVLKKGTSNTGQNTVIGSQAARELTTGQKNIAIGYASLWNAVNSSDNVVVGIAMGGQKGPLGHNVAVGEAVGTSWTNGSFNTAVGDYAMYGAADSSPATNTALGHEALQGTKGNANVAIGAESIRNVSLGQYNTALGFFAGQKLIQGSNNMFLGDFVDNYDIQNWYNNSNIFIGVGGKLKAHYDGTNDWKFEPNLSTPLYARATNGMSIGYPTMTPFTNWANTNSFESTRVPATNITFRFLVPSNVVTVVYTNLGYPYSNVIDFAQIKTNALIGALYITNYGTTGDALINVPFYTASPSTNAPAWNEFVTKDYVDNHAGSGSPLTVLSNNSPISSGVSNLNFIGASVSNGPNGTANIEITAVSSPNAVLTNSTYLQPIGPLDIGVPASNFWGLIDKGGTQSLVIRPHSIDINEGLTVTRGSITNYAAEGYGLQGRNIYGNGNLLLYHDYSVGESNNAMNITSVAAYINRLDTYVNNLNFGSNYFGMLSSPANGMIYLKSQNLNVFHGDSDMLFLDAPFTGTYSNAVITDGLTVQSDANFEQDVKIAGSLIVSNGAGFSNDVIVASTDNLSSSRLNTNGSFMFSNSLGSFTMNGGRIVLKGPFGTNTLTISTNSFAQTNGANYVVISNGTILVPRTGTLSFGSYVYALVQGDGSAKSITLNPANDTSAVLVVSNKNWIFGDWRVLAGEAKFKITADPTGNSFAVNTNQLMVTNGVVIATKAAQVGYASGSPYTNYYLTNTLESYIPPTNFSFSVYVPQNIVTVVTNGLGTVQSNTVYGTAGSVNLNVPAYTYSSTTSSPAANELATAQWVRGLFSGGQLLYNCTNAQPYFTNYDLWYSALPTTNSVGQVRTYNAVTTGQYLGTGIASTQRFTTVFSPMTVNAYLSFNTGGGRAVSVQPEFYYCYEEPKTNAPGVYTNILGDYTAGAQALSAGTNLYSWVISFPTITSTNTSGFWVIRRFKVASQNANPNVSIHGSGNTPSTIGFENPAVSDPSLGTRGATNIAYTNFQFLSSTSYDTNTRTLTVQGPQIYSYTRTSNALTDTNGGFWIDLAYPDGGFNAYSNFNIYGFSNTYATNWKQSCTLIITNRSASDIIVYLTNLMGVLSTDGARSWTVSNGQAGALTIDRGWNTNIAFRNLR